MMAHPVTGPMHPVDWYTAEHADGARFTASSNTHTAYDAAADILPRWYIAARARLARMTR